MKNKAKKVWIDLDNSPHIPFFNPIINELKNKGYDVFISVRDYAQAIGLANYYNFKYTRLGSHYGKNKWLKTIGVFVRTLQMLPILFREKPDLAMSHGSRSQFLFASLTGIRSVVATDYEHSAEFPLLKPTLGIVPEALPDTFLKKYFKHVAKFPGIKEDVYIQNLKPDASLMEYLKISTEEILVSVRPPASMAHYHTEKSEKLFKKTMKHVLDNAETRVVLLPRTKEQGEEIREEWKEYFESGKVIIPDKVLDGLNLIWFSDLVISGGGTMIREAAALNVPAFSIFGGKIGAVDEYLQNSGRLKLIENEQDIFESVKLQKREKPTDNERKTSPALDKIIEEVIKLLETEPRKNQN
ncbi:DUF354 domain-containing protein [Fulvivirgaceae bacterium BMA10]|uniref:DUF354 domain-containing protein n=1 Tax=Splendidivirga corallicola TaxID=3051826 RepID=A0ABT8KXH2_9BACT|nr:DUF354 domain-containing protein [Fulvivirgaceae bacterium BMA10]